jgi:putative membrane protein
VGLELVFRNQTAYNRFWTGRLHFSTITTAVRCLSREILSLVPAPALPGRQFGTDCHRIRDGSKYGELGSGTEEPVLSAQHEAKTVETVKILVAMMYAVKNHLRAEWGVALSPGNGLTEDGEHTDNPEYKDLLPKGLQGHEHLGLGLTLQLATFVENFIKIGARR